VDEIHSLCSGKRGVHLSLSLERLQALAEQEILRIGLSATQRPLEAIAKFLGGYSRQGDSRRARPVTIVDAGQKKSMDLRVECPVADFSALPQGSAWPYVFDEMLRQILTHRTTLVFVNSRRLAERIAAKLNEMASGEANEGFAAGRSFNLHAVPRGTPPSASPAVPAAGATPLVQAYHGSMSRQARERMEGELKEGRIRGLVATSSLELGIDIGSIDCVLQVQSPKAVARGLQRVGRSGHLVTAQSKGRIYPTHREDLVESAVVARAMDGHEVEFTSIPRNCLDVLAQQIVAMVSVEDQDVEALLELVRQSACYRDLSEDLYLGVIAMLAGRSSAGSAMPPRVSWDKVGGKIRALPGSARIAVTGGGTIADRGYFGVYLRDAKTRVGEVDEEFVFETRAGDTFLLGTSVWRVIDIDANRVIVEPAPGQPARMPFWRGEGIGRSFELGEKVGEFRRLLAERLDRPGCLEWLRSEYPIDANAAWNIQEYFRRQRQATGIIPHDRRLVVEAFRDELGDPRLVVHSSFGRRVNGLLGLVLARLLLDRTGDEGQMLYNDDGILLRLSASAPLPLDLLTGFSADTAREILLEEIVKSPLFAGQFRQNAGRALLFPKLIPGKRTPLWLQRLRAADLLEVARRSDDFPIVIETVREVLHDVLDFTHFMDVGRALESGAIAVSTVTTEVPSPFGASLLFDFLSVYMYESDQPKADRLSQYATINREILAEILDEETIASLLRPDAIAAVERELQHVEPGYRARSPEELMELLLRIGDLTEEEVLERCEADARSMLDTLARDGRALKIETAAGPRWIAGEEADLYANIAAAENLRGILARYMRNHGPRSSSELAARYALPPKEADEAASALAASMPVVRGRFRSGTDSGGEPQWVYRPVLERIHRRTIGILRKEITPSTIDEFSGFLLSWQGLASAPRAPGSASLRGTLEQLEGLALHAEILERDILRARLGEYATERMDELTRQGEILWTGAGAGRLLCLTRGSGGVFLPPGQEADLGEPARRVLDCLRREGASFYSDLRAWTHLSLAALNAGLSELLWSGLATNDVFSELAGVKRSGRIPAEAPMEPVRMVLPQRAPGRHPAVRSARRAIREVPGWSGRWSAVHTRAVLGETLTDEERAAAQAAQLLERYGIVAREFLQRENLLPWGTLALAFQRMEMRGEIRRGYFVQGLSGMQYALPAAVEELRRLKSVADDTVTLLNSCDPANVYGTGIEWAAGERSARLPGNFLACARGRPFLVFESEGSRIRTVGRPDTEQVIAAIRRFLELTRLPANLHPLRLVSIEQWDGERPGATSWSGVLRQLGFRGDANQTLRFDRYS
jgi:ATP-dependent Lhr-like helicase